MVGRKLVAADIAVSALVPILTVWVYEVSNLAVLAAQGVQATLNVGGFLPLGVAGVVQSGLSPLTKVAQVVLATAFILPFGLAFSRYRLQTAKTLVIASVGVFVASTYWEMLSLLSSVPMEVHTVIFIGGTCAITMLLLLGTDRPRQAGIFPTRTRA